MGTSFSLSQKSGNLVPSRTPFPFRPSQYSTLPYLLPTGLTSLQRILEYVHYVDAGITEVKAKEERGYTT